MPPPAPSEDGLFDQAMELRSQNEREAFLKEKCGDDVALFNRMRSLLECHSEADQLRFFNEDPPRPEQDSSTSAPRTIEESGSMIGRYQLIEKIGEGGFGVVYLAEQQKPIFRKVALKIIKLGMDTREVIARFEVERQAMALMDHPNIAKVLDTGSTEDGRPYFVMDYAPGTAITKHCDARNLTLRARLDLFLTVCDAIQHAHFKGIIHRDIKPGNVLVTDVNGRPTPKIIDFGIAKALEQKLTDLTLVTQQRQFIGTPAYMSPEQASGGGSGIDTRSDIYSLGVLLYEMLTGVTPWDSMISSPSDFEALRRTLKEEEAVKPSTRIRAMEPPERTALAQKRQIESAEFPRLLKGDLDWIVLKALAKDRDLRYRTVADFERDIQSHTRDQPISAVAPSTTYLLKKYARRHRAGLLIITLIGLILAFSSTFSFWKAKQALEARQEAIDLRGHAENSAIEATEERNKARLQASKSDRLVADQLLNQNEVSKALVYLARSLQNDPGNRTTYKRLMSTLTQRHLALAHAHPAQPETQGLEGHFSDDGAKMAIIHEDLTLSFVDTISGRQVRSKEKLQSLDYGAQVRFTNCGSRAVTMETENGCFRVWDINTAKPITPIFQHGSSCMHFKLTPDDRLIISTGADSRIRFFNPDTGDELYKAIPLAMPTGMFGLAAEGSKLLVPQGYRKALEIWDISAEAPPVLSPHQAPFTTESQNYFYLDALSPDRSLLLVYQTPPNDTFFDNKGRKTLSAWDISSGDIIWENDNIGDEIVSVAWSGDGTRFMASFLSGKHEILDGLSGNLIAPISARGLAGFQGGTDHQTWIGQDDNAGSIHIWERETGRHLIPIIETNPPKPLIHLSPSSRRIHYYRRNESNGVGTFEYSGSRALPYDFAPPTGDQFVDMTPDWKTSAWIDQHNKLQLRNHRTGLAHTTPQESQLGVTEARFAKAGRHLIALAIDRKTMTCYSVPGMEIVSEFRWPGPGYIGKWDLSHDGSTLVFAIDAPGDKNEPGPKQIQSWQPLANSDPILLDSFDGDYIDLAINPDGTQVFLGLLQARSVIYRKTSTWKKMAIPGQGGFINGEFSPDGKWLAVVSPETGVHVYDLIEDHWTARHLENSEFGQVSKVQFSPNGQRILVTGLRKELMATGNRAVRPDRYPPETFLIWDWSRNELASDRLELNGMMPFGFSEDETRVLLRDASGPKIMDLSPALEPPEEWLFRFVENYCGFQFNSEGQIEALPVGSLDEASSAIHDLSDLAPNNELLQWCRWLTADRLQRPVSPGASVTLPEHIDQLLLSNQFADLRQAGELAPFDARVMAKTASLLLAHDDPSIQHRAHWLISESTRIAPDNPAALFAQAVSFQKNGNHEAAWDTLQKTPAGDRDNWPYRNLEAELLLHRNKPRQALAAYERAITLLENRMVPKDWTDLEKLRFKRIGLLQKLKQWDALQESQKQLFRIPPRDPELSPKLIDLTDFYNAGLSQDWQITSPGNLALLSPGLNILNDVPFDTRGIIQLQCKLMQENPGTQSLINQYPPRVTDIPVSQTAGKLHFLQASLYGSSVFAPKGTLVVSYLIHYADGEQRKVEIKLGEQTRDWWIGKAANSPAFAPEAGLELAWKGYISAGNVGLYKTTWTNPRPLVEITSIDLISAMAVPGPFLVAITLE